MAPIQLGIGDSGKKRNAPYNVGYASEQQKEFQEMINKTGAWSVLKSPLQVPIHLTIRGA